MTEIAATRILLVEDDFLVALDLSTGSPKQDSTSSALPRPPKKRTGWRRRKSRHWPSWTSGSPGPRDGVDAAIELYQALQIPSIFATAPRRRCDQASCPASAPPRGGAE